MSELADLYNESYYSNYKKVVEENKQLQAENSKLKKCLDTIMEVCKSCRENALCYDCEYAPQCQSELQDYIISLQIK